MKYFLEQISRSLCTSQPVSYALHQFNLVRFPKTPDPNRVLYINPEQITAQLVGNSRTSARWIRGSIKDGDWDRNIRQKYTLDNDELLRSFEQHFVYGVEWVSTESFAEGGIFWKKLKNGECVKGCKTLSDLAHKYELYYDPLYEEIKKNGMMTPDLLGRDALFIYISRDGDFLWCNNGNHRLRIAKVLRLPQIPVLVRARHKIWVEHRQRLAKTPGKTSSFHPDLMDLFD